MRKTDGGDGVREARTCFDLDRLLLLGERPVSDGIGDHFAPQGASREAADRAARRQRRQYEEENEFAHAVPRDGMLARELLEMAMRMS